MRFLVSLNILALCLVIVTGCGNKEEQAAQEEGSALDQLTKSAEQAQKSMEQMRGGEQGDRTPVPPVSFKVLMTFLPAEVAGMKAQNPDGETGTMGKWSYSKASTSYSTDDGIKNARVEIMDLAFISSLYGTYNILFNMKFSRETMEGFERSSKLGEYPAFEKWTTASKTSEFTVLVADRFIVVVNTEGLDETAARKVAEGIDLKKLATTTAS